MAKRIHPDTQTLGKLICFAAVLGTKDYVPELSYCDVTIRKKGDKEFTVQVPFFLGAIEVLKDIDPLIWSKLSGGVDVEGLVDLKVNSFCQMFNIRMKDFCHFFSPENQNRDITDIILDRDSTCQDIAGVIFDYVICNQMVQYDKIVNMFDFVRLN